MPKRPSGFSRYLLRKQARVTLKSFLLCLWPYNDPKRDYSTLDEVYIRHFKKEFTAIWVLGEKAERPYKKMLELLPLSGPGEFWPDWYALAKVFEADFFGRLTKFQEAVYSRLDFHPTDGWKACNVFFDILLATAKPGASPSAQALKGLAERLNQPIKRIAFYPNSPVGRDAYSFAKAVPTRAAAELLLRYLNLIHHCDPVHGICEQCGGLMMTAHGKRKVTCSAECHSRYFSKEYFRNKQRERRTNMRRMEIAKARKAVNLR